MADDALREAVERSVRAQLNEHPDRTQNTVVAEFIVIAAAIGWNADDEEISQVHLIPVGPLHRLSGLVHEARIRIDAETLEDD